MMEVCSKREGDWPELYANPVDLGPEPAVAVPSEDQGRQQSTRETARADAQRPLRLVGTNEISLEGGPCAVKPSVDGPESAGNALGVLAHELRNPLTGLSGMLELLLGSLQVGRPAGREEFELLETAQAEVRRLSDILSSVVEAERSGLRSLQLKCAAVDLREIVKAAVRPMLPGTHPITIECGPPGPVRVYADRHRLEQVFRNLLGNAAKYSPPASLIRLSLRRVEEGVLASVGDEGVGIPPAEAERIFERFYRASNVHGQDPGGVGLGLYLCRRIVEAHGGRIWADHRVGPGATIHVLLPTPSGDAWPDC